ncbi:MAG TPA: hypothetical protein PLP50_01625 [Thermoanaerobaculia bacterium]|nr:hypothetical protein [Thermoanaerobaculia bacterium]HQN06773.1 hypothetical protein [Thermoanaerobaculia bacterium]HQP84949.1 hypothetical protein [Thermoanaerobaculia bacterium]
MSGPPTGAGGMPSAAASAERNPARIVAYVTSAVGALTGPVSFLAFPGFGVWTTEDLPGAGVVALAALVMASPFAAFLLAARLSKSRTGAAVVAALALVAVLFGALYYVWAAVEKNVLILLASVGVPAVQWLMALPAVVAALVLRPKRWSAPR